jgi:hypothetical protein
MIQVNIDNAAWLAVAGAVCEIVGAWLIARALLAKPQQMLAQSMSYAGPSGPLLRMFCEQKIDTYFGLGLLIFGFIFQAGSSAGIKINLLLLLCLVSILVIGFIFYIVRRDSLVKHQVQLCLSNRIPSVMQRTTELAFPANG